MVAIHVNTKPISLCIFTGYGCLATERWSNWSLYSLYCIWPTSNHQTEKMEGNGVGGGRERERGILF